MSTISEKSFDKAGDTAVISSYSITDWDDDRWHKRSFFKTEFNFASRQCTRMIDSMVWYKTDKLLSTAITSTTQNFSDIENAADIIEAHEQLKSLGGNPPPLDEILSSSTHLFKGKTRQTP